MQLMEMDENKRKRHVVYWSERKEEGEEDIHLTGVNGKEEEEEDMHPVEVNDKEKEEEDMHLTGLNEKKKKKKTSILPV